MTYHIVGDGPDRPRLEQLIRQAGLGQRVRVLGYLSESELRREYQAADLFVLPSRADPGTGEVEGFGLVYLEAAAWGKPAIGANCGGALDAIAHGETGLLIEPDCPGQLCAALQSLLRNPDRAQQLGQRARQRALTEFSWERSAAALHTALTQCLENNGGIA